jgi:protein SCO1
MTQVLEQMPATTQSRITPIFISIDPERDTPDALKEYIHYFHPRFIALTGASAQLADVAKKYGVYYQIHKKSPQDKEYPVDHSSYIYVMDKDGAYVSHFTKDTSVEMMVNKLTALIGK